MGYDEAINFLENLRQRFTGQSGQSITLRAKQEGE